MMFAEQVAYLVENRRLRRALERLENAEKQAVARAASAWVGAQQQAAAPRRRRRSPAKKKKNRPLAIAPVPAPAPALAPIAPATATAAPVAATAVPKPKRKRARSAMKTSRFTGVHWSRQNQKWMSYISHESLQHYLGGFLDEEVAARAYDAAARKYKATARQKCRRTPLLSVSPFVVLVFRVLTAHCCISITGDRTQHLGQFS